MLIQKSFLFASVLTTCLFGMEGDEVHSRDPSSTTGSARNSITPNSDQESLADLVERNFKKKIERVKLIEEKRRREELRYRSTDIYDDEGNLVARAY